MTDTLSFGRFELQPASRQLLSDGKPVAVGARAFDVLCALIERRDRLVTKEELLDLVWTGVVVEENNLQVQISALRKLLGPQAITTIPGRGYRFAAALNGRADGAIPTAAPAAKAAGAPAARQTNLPAELPPLYGRDEELRALRALIDAQRLVTVVGAGGIGKSRLAQAAAHALPGNPDDGVWMVELAGLSDPQRVPSAVAQTLGIPLPGRQPALDELVAGMAQRNLLLVLDNCEHLLDATATLVQAILDQAPNVTLLATSQEPLHLPAEQQFRIAPLAIPAGMSGDDARAFGAVALFEARVRAVDARFALDEESLPLAIDICRRLDGLPLAIELAAARVGTIGLRPLRDKLDARFRLLTGGSRATLRRHQTLRAALEWSHALLNDTEQTVFRRLGVFAGGFTIAMAQAAATDAGLDEWTVLDQVSALVDKSLVVADAGDPPRYRLLESARAYALEQLATGETTDMLRRHAQAMRDFIERVDGANLDGELRTDQYAALVLPELDNLRAAHGWATGEDGDREIALAIAAHAGALIDYTNECRDWLLTLPRPGADESLDPALAARYWRAITASNMTGHVPRDAQIDAARRGKALYAALGRPRRMFWCLAQLAKYLRADDPDAAKAAIDEARRLVGADWPHEFRIHLLRYDGTAARLGGRRDEALALVREAARLGEASGDWRLEVIDRNNLVDILWLFGPIEDAAHEVRKLVDEVLARPAAYGDMAIVFANALGILSETGLVDEASALAGEALLFARRSGYFYIEEWAYFFWRRGQVAAAARMLGASDAEQTRTRTPLQPNEQRLMAEVRAALAAQLPPAAFAQHLAAGAELGKIEMLALVADALA